MLTYPAPGKLTWLWKVCPRTQGTSCARSTFRHAIPCRPPHTGGPRAHADAVPEDDTFARDVTHASRLGCGPMHTMASF